MEKEIPKFGVKEIVQFVGVSELEPMEQQTVQLLSTENYEKIKRAMKNITNLVIHVKKYEKGGERKKYSIHVRAICPTAAIESCNADDFELPRALHKAFTDIKEQIKHKFHSDTTRGKAYE
ncbi:MAG: hypothetical protein QW666_02580 [Candidatus Woesearchaeota archaeon]